MVNIIRSIIFNFFYIFGSLFWSIALLWSLPLPQMITNKIVRNTYFAYMRFISTHIMGIKLEIRGLENLPKTGSYILASKHQSAYETLMLPLISKNIAIILKRELTWLPIWGWYPIGMGMIPIDRGSAIQAIKSIKKGVKRVAAQERPILIFPQGTRTKPGAVADYKPGLAMIYKGSDLPIIPMALNSGVYWPKNTFLKKSGTVVFEFLSAIPAGLPHKEAIAKTEALLEKHSNALLD